MQPIASSRRARRIGPPPARGFVTAVVVLFLIASVVFALSQVVEVTGRNVTDASRQGDGEAAFFLAESGLEHAHASVANLLAGTFTNASCTGLASTFTLGRGTVTLSAESTPASCDNGGATACRNCAVTSSATVGVAKRTVTRDLGLTVTNGTYCNGATTDCRNAPVNWSLTLKNTSANAAVGVFNLSYIKQGSNAATCAVGSHCRLQLDLTSPSSGVNSTGVQGNVVPIPGSSSYPIYQTMTRAGNNLVEVGALFYGNGAADVAGATAAPGAAAYWDDSKNHQATTVGDGGAAAGGTNDGAAGTNSSCKTPGTDHSQTCDTWCQGGDTLVYTFAGNVAGRGDQLTGVTFGTNAGSGQNIAMTRIAKYPTALSTGAPSNVDAEIWYARNPNFSGASAQAAGASSYKGRGSGAIGASWTTGNSSPNDTAITTSDTAGNGTFTVGAGTGWPSQLILPGDTITSTDASITVTATVGTQSASSEAGAMTTGQGGRGTYGVSNVRSNGTLVATKNTTFNGKNRTWTVNSTALHVTACTICFFANGDALSGLIAGRTISANQSTPSTSFGSTEVAGGIGRYTISGAASRVAPGNNLYAGTPGATLYLPSTSSQPVVSTPRQLIALRSGTGAIGPGTHVTAVNSAPSGAYQTTAFTVSATPSTPLDGASLCAGTCAFFVPGATTYFALGGITANFNEWASGFVCLKGVDQAPLVVNSATVSPGRWREPVQ